MLEVVLRSIFLVLFTVLCWLVCWLVFIPIGFVVATPFVFVVALCRREGTFKGNVMNEYRQWWKFWKEWGILMVPPW